MFKKSITFVNAMTEQEQTETLYFNLTVPEVADLGFAMEEDFESEIRNMVETEDRRKMFMFFKLIMAHSYGRRTPDGTGFAKKKEWLDELFSGFAYEELFIWLFSNPDNAASFFNSIMPPKKSLERITEANNNHTASDEPVKSPRSMTREELEAAFLAKMQTKTPANEVTSS